MRGINKKAVSLKTNGRHSEHRGWIVPDNKDSNVRNLINQADADTHHTRAEIYLLLHKNVIIARARVFPSLANNHDIWYFRGEPLALSGDG